MPDWGGSDAVIWFDERPHSAHGLPSVLMSHPRTRGSPRGRWAVASTVGGVVLALSAAGAAGAASPTIKITAEGFVPSTVTIVAGDTVTWRNTTAAEHEVVADDGSFDSGVLLHDDQFANLFEVPGTYAYHDALDTTLRAKVVVKVAPPTPTPHGTPPPTPPSGSVPPGFKSPVPVPTEPLASPAPSGAGATVIPTAGASAAPADESTSGGPGSGTVALLLVAAVAVVAALLWAIRRRGSPSR